MTTHQSMSIVRARAMVSALLQITALEDADGRNLYRREVERELRRSLGTVRDANAELDLFLLVRACDDVAGGVEALLRVVNTLNRGSSAAAELQRLSDEWADEQRLIAALDDTPVGEIALAIFRVTGADPKGTTIDQLVQDVGWSVSEPWAAPAILAVADVISLRKDGNAALFDWLTGTGRRLRLDQLDLERIRQVSHASESPDPGPDVVGRGSRDEEPEHTVKRITIEETATIAAPTAIRGGTPARNPYFTGRETMLEQLGGLLAEARRASVLPEMALYGYGGVGKSQIAIEYVYRNVDNYQLIWWMPAEDLGAVRASLSVLASRLGLPTSGSMEQTIRSVLDALASTTSLKWLLVYDNADEPADLDNLIPSTGGDVLVTSRNPAWTASSPVLMVDVFTRDESRQLLQKRRPELTDTEADRLAEALGDLPLALEQAVSWLITTLTSVDDYLEEFARRAKTLLDEGRPRQYPTTVLTFVALAITRLRDEAPVAAQLLEMMAFLGPDPLPVTLLWEGRGAAVTEPLRTALQERNDIARGVRDLGRFGLARVDGASKRITVHRLVQLVLREELIESRREEGLQNARRLLAAANPGYPDDRQAWARHEEIRPHIKAADLIHGSVPERQTLLDQVRYIFNTGDFEGCRDLVEDILAVWDKPEQDGGQGPDDPLTLLAIRRYADALRSLGDPRAASFARAALDRMSAALGEEHPYTLGAVMGVGADLRVAGDFGAAKDLDDRNLEIHLAVLGEGDASTLRAMNSVAVNRRWAGDFQGAYEIDVDAERHSRSSLGDREAWTFFAIEGQARDLLGLGRYEEALRLQERILPDQIELLGAQHSTVLRANILIAAMLRKTGRVAEALVLAREIYRSHTVRFGVQHNQSIAATLTWANTLRAATDPAQALQFISEARNASAMLYGEHHPLTLCVDLNAAIIQRTLNYDRDALLTDEALLPLMREGLGEAHPYTLALMVNYGNDLSRIHRLTEAYEMSSTAWELSKAVRGVAHPYTLHAGTNTALDLIQTGKRDEGEKLLAEMVRALEQTYGAQHPEVQAAMAYRRLECELEPPLL